MRPILEDQYLQEIADLPERPEVPRQAGKSMLDLYADDWGIGKVQGGVLHKKPVEVRPEIQDLRFAEKDWSDFFTATKAPIKPATRKEIEAALGYGDHTATAFAMGGTPDSSDSEEEPPPLPPRRGTPAPPLPPRRGTPAPPPHQPSAPPSPEPDPRPPARKLRPPPSAEKAGTGLEASRGIVASGLAAATKSLRGVFESLAGQEGDRLGAQTLGCGEEEAHTGDPR